MNLACEADLIANHIRGVPKHWDGRRAILQMKYENDKQWKQMEWIGFYFEFLAKKLLKDLVVFPGPRYGRVTFDALGLVPWDFKTHVCNAGNDQVIVNDIAAIRSAISQYGKVGLVLAVGRAEYDHDGAFRSWHEALKGAPHNTQLTDNLEELTLG
ncbi:hypothetical protein HPY42_03180 [Coprothermobacteraceae bacterium]|nr:hypothetical protein [Coprothermobacteraceae bacterium]